MIDPEDLMEPGEVLREVALIVAVLALSLSIAYVAAYVAIVTGDAEPGCGCVRMLSEQRR